MWARLRSFWRNLWHRSAMEQDMVDELAFHLERRAEDLMRRDGVSVDEARRRARLEFGSVEKHKDEARRSLGLRPLDELRADLRYAWRSYAHSKVFTAAAVTTLALGIGATTAIFSLIDAVMLRRLPVERPAELASVLSQEPGEQPEDGFTNAIWEAVRDQQDVFSGAFAWSTPKAFDLGHGDSVQNVRGLMVSGNYFNTLGVPPAAGRLIVDADDRRGCVPVAVLSYAFWQTRFGGSGAALGSILSLNRQPFQVIGVSAPRFFGVEVGKTFDLAIPLCASARFDRRNLDSRSRWWLSIMGRVKPGLTNAQLGARLAVLSEPIMRAALPDTNASGQQRFLQTKLVAISSATGPSGLRRTFGQPLSILMAAVALVLLIGCANIAGLMLARAAARSREIAIRTALGASRARLVRQLLTESILLSWLGAGLGVLFARWGTSLLVRTLTTTRNPVFLDLSLDWRVLAFAAAVAVLTGVLVGVLPAVRSTDFAVSAVTKAQAAAAGGERRVRFHAGKWMVAGQVALSLILLIGGGLLLRTFVKLIRVDLGFDASNVLVVMAKPPWFAADIVKMSPEERTLAHEEIARELRTLPGVLSVARTFTTPIGDDNYMTSVTADMPGAPPGVGRTGYFNFVAPGYFTTLRTPIVAGRDFDDRDTTTAPPVAIVNETLARQYFPGGGALGKRLRIHQRPVPVEVVGLVKDATYESVREVTPPTVFMPATQAPPSGAAQEFVLRTSVPPSVMIPSVQRVVREVNPDIPLEFQTLAQQVDDNLVQERLLARLAGFFGGLAMLLAMIGLYGVLSYLVAHRQMEFGVRMALGARPGSILWLVMRDVLLVLAAGVTVGLAVALATARVLRQLLFGLEPHDPATIAIAVTLLSAMAALAGYLPARRATRVDPIIALRSE
jgi:putative ABC transport system permease protein